ncbi:MAG: PEGA domain-containing protein, partial [Sulfuriferula sp.]
HEVYAIGYPGEFTLTQQGLDTKGKLIKATGELMQGVGRLGGVIYVAFQNASNKQRMLYAGAPVLALVLIVAGLALVKRGPTAPAKQVVVRYYPDSMQAASSVPSGSAVKNESKQLVIGSAKVEAAKKNDKHSTSIARVRTLEETTGTAAVMSLVVLPWGEIYLDGRMQGVSPPLIELQVAPGRHEIEIKNSTFPVYKQVIQVKVGEKLKIKHTFKN